MATINKILFIGSKQIGLKCLSEIYSLSPDSLIGIITIDDRNEKRSVFVDLNSFASVNSIKFHIAQNRKHFESLIKELKPELCIVVGWYWMISSETINIVPNGFIGVHFSLLPKYRGGSPLVWAMINGEETVGMSLFSITEGLDEGDIWAQQTIKVGFEDYISDVLKKLEDVTVSFFRTNYLAILNIRLKPTPQDSTEATYGTMRYTSDGLINWGKSAVEIYNFIRAQSEPYPGAYTLYDGKKLTIWKAHHKNITYYGSPGKVARITKEGVYVVCGDQKPIILEIVELEDNGNKEPAHELIKSIRTHFAIFPIEHKIDMVDR